MITVRAYTNEDIPALRDIWNKVVADGIAFPQESLLDEDEAAALFAAQSRTGAAVLDGEVVGLYILHPNNIGRCGHIANASYAVKADTRGRHVGEALVKDSLAQAKALGFTLMQFNAVVASNAPAVHLYERLGFTPLGTIPGGFRMKDGRFEDIRLYWIALGVER